MRTSADAYLLRLCGQSRRYAAEIDINDAVSKTITRAELDEDLAQLGGHWFASLGEIAQVPAVTKAGVRAKAEICRRAIATGVDDLGPELALVSSLLADIFRQTATRGML